MKTTMDKTSFNNLFATFDRGGASSRFQSLRQAARARFQELPWPSPRTEDWRFTNVAPLAETPFEFAPVDLTLNLALLPARIAPNAIRLLFVNGRMVRPMSGLAKPAGVDIGSLADFNALPLGKP